MGGLTAGIFEVIVFDASECPSNLLLVPLFPNVNTLNHRWLPRLLLSWQIESGTAEVKKANRAVTFVESAAVEFTWKSWMLTLGIGSTQGHGNRQNIPFTQLGLGYKQGIFSVQVYWLLSDHKIKPVGFFGTS
ncbi:MAG: hypothetical protein IPN29_06360 [Saprospiraceae bacterium]|nr:hypothetical protein [Saprospiraceae bacterium]